MANAFISYSHADEKSLERLHKHLAVLQRDGSLATWTDHALLPGGNIGQEINAQLEVSDLFVALVSPDYLASNYCYEKEFTRALELAEKGQLRIVAVIVEPCDWLSTPLNKLLALPKDGKPIANWTNPNNAYLDVVTQLRRLLTAAAPAEKSAAKPGDADANAPRRVRLKRDFDKIEKAEFADQSFKVIRDYFSAASTELAQASEDIRTRLEDMDQNSFTCSIVNRARQRGGEAHITVRINKGRGHFFGEINFVNEAHAADNTSHGGISVEADEYQLYLAPSRLMGGREEGMKFTAERAAEWLWNQFVERAGIEYE